MNAQSRYLTDDQGREWFAMHEASNNYGEPYDLMPPYKAFGDWAYIPIDQVKITDDLACSRAELGPVYVVGKQTGMIMRLDGVRVGYVLVSEPDFRLDCDVYAWPESAYRLATLEELKKAGIE